MSNTSFQNPVELVISAFGGVRKLARILGINPASVSRWRRHGLVPSSVQRKILERAREREIAITAHDIVFGKEME